MSIDLANDSHLADTHLAGSNGIYELTRDSVCWAFDRILLGLARPVKESYIHLPEPLRLKTDRFPSVYPLI